MGVQRVGRDDAPFEHEGFDERPQVAEFVTLIRHAELRQNDAEPVRERAHQVALGSALPGAAAQSLAVYGQPFERGGGRGGEDWLGPPGHARFEAGAVEPLKMRCRVGLRRPTAAADAEAREPARAVVLSPHGDGRLGACAALTQSNSLIARWPAIPS
ncbi:MAG TPA: hypothetical protein VHU19_00305 [Pyrinomonadaceae bacterium]|jgi:hypothetical protein|nr:hypothetical protein [Pyrinomonadaceae bacterium]